MWKSHTLSMHASLQPWKLAEIVTTSICEGLAPRFTFYSYNDNCTRGGCERVKSCNRAEWTQLLECNRPNVVRNWNWPMDTFYCSLGLLMRWVEHGRVLSLSIKSESRLIHNGGLIYLYLCRLAVLYIQGKAALPRDHLAYRALAARKLLWGS
jgi:hypothetical protein